MQHSHTENHKSRMASRGKATITTTEILAELKKRDGENKELFYLYVSTSGIEVIGEGHQQQGHQTRITDFFSPIQNDNNEDTMDDDDDDDAMSQPLTSVQPLLSQQRKKVRRTVMNHIHDNVLPSLLCQEGWKKVVDKDGKPTYRALYFNVIEKTQDETDIAHIQRVSKVRERIAEEAEKVKKEYNVNFKTNSLLSSPILYDSSALEELSMREPSMT